MDKSKVTFVFGFTCLALLAVVTFLAIKLDKASNKDIKGEEMFGDKPIDIGVILPQTGKAASFGEDMRIGLELALAEVNSKAEKIKLNFQDDQCDSKKAVSAYQFLHNVERVDVIIGSFCSPTTLAIAPLAEKDQVLLITPASAAYTISETGDFIFRNHSHDKAEMAALAPYTAERYKNVAVVYDTTNDTLILNDKFFTEFFERLGGQVIARIPITGNTGSYKTELIKLQKNIGDLDAIFVATLTNDAVVIMKELDELGIRKPILGNKAFGTSDYINNLPAKLTEGNVYAEAEYDESTSPEFWSKFLNKTGRKPTIFAPQAYDTLKILAQLIGAKCPAAEPVCLRDALYDLENYQGAAGTVYFDESGDAIKKIVIKQIQGGEFIVVEQ